MPFQPDAVQQTAFQMVMPLTRLVRGGTLSLAGGAATNTLVSGVATVDIDEDLVTNEGG